MVRCRYCGGASLLRAALSTPCPVYLASTFLHMAPYLQSEPTSTLNTLSALHAQLTSRPALSFLGPFHALSPRWLRGTSIVCLVPCDLKPSTAVCVSCAPTATALRAMLSLHGVSDMGVMMVMVMMIFGKG